MGRVFRNTLDRADLDALRHVEVAHAFGTFGRFDLVDFFAHGDGAIGAFWLADITVNAFISDD